MKHWKSNKGNAVLELALVLPLLLLILFGITEFGRAIMTTNMLNSAAREGARLAAVSLEADSLRVKDRVKEVLSAAAIDPDKVQVQVEYLPANNAVRVRVATEFRILSGIVWGHSSGSVELVGATVMKYEVAED